MLPGLRASSIETTISTFAPVVAQRAKAAKYMLACPLFGSSAPERHWTMAPLEDLQSRDLAWISDFVMQQVVLMMRPMMDHLQQTDSSVDYAQRQVHRVNMDLAELKADVDRTNKYLAILRQGLGVQNEGKCVIQRSLESNTRTVKRLDEQMESMLTVLRGVEDSFEQLCTDFRGARAQHEELSQKVTEHTVSLDDMQVRVDKMCEAPAKEEVPNGEARIEVWHRELRELRRNQIGLVQVPKLEASLLRKERPRRPIRGLEKLSRRWRLQRRHMQVRSPPRGRWWKRTVAAKLQSAPAGLAAALVDSHCSPRTPSRCTHHGSGRRMPLITVSWSRKMRTASVCHGSPAGPVLGQLRDLLGIPKRPGFALQRPWPSPRPAGNKGARLDSTKLKLGNSIDGAPRG
eukprot:s356_g13.t2